MEQARLHAALPEPEQETPQRSSPAGSRGEMGPRAGLDRRVIQGRVQLFRFRDQRRSPRLRNLRRILFPWIRYPPEDANLHDRPQMAVRIRVGPSSRDVLTVDESSNKATLFDSLFGARGGMNRICASANSMRQMCYQGPSLRLGLSAFVPTVAEGRHAARDSRDTYRSLLHFVKGRLFMERLLLALAALAVGSISASAADIAARYTKAPPVLGPVYNWTGFYVGLNAGGAWS